MLSMREVIDPDLQEWHLTFVLIPRFLLSHVPMYVSPLPIEGLRPLPLHRGCLYEHAPLHVQWRLRPAVEVPSC